MTSSPQALDLSFLAGLNPDLYHSISHSLGILNDNGKGVDFFISVSIIMQRLLLDLDLDSTDIQVGAVPTLDHT